MAFLNDLALDALTYLDAASRTGEELHICSSLPTDRATTLTASLGQKVGPTTTGPADGTTSGRKMTIDAISDGTVDTTGTATHWAYIDDTNLLAANTLNSSLAVTATNTFTLAAIDIEIPDPA
jgi:hypothetical protein